MLRKGKSKQVKATEPKEKGTQMRIEYPEDKEHGEEHNPNVDFYANTNYMTWLKNCLEWEEIY
jgi:hypothetical protein